MFSTMWGTVLVLALLTVNDPVRLGITVLLISRPRPLLNLLAFWLGGMLAGVTVAGCAVMFLRDFLPAAMQNMTKNLMS